MARTYTAEDVRNDTRGVLVDWLDQQAPEDRQAATRAALDAENARGDDKRVTVVDYLETELRRYESAGDGTGAAADQGPPAPADADDPMTNWNTETHGPRPVE